MDVHNINDPVDHTGVAFGYAYVFRLNQSVAMFCSISPDLVDKSSSALKETDGRYINHAILFVFQAARFFLWSLWWGLAALVGGLSHLIIGRFDGFGFCPLVFLFKDHFFPNRKFHWSFVHL